MRLFCVVLDGHGAPHAVAMRAPTAVYREIAAATGSAKIIWCSAPPQGISISTLISRFETRLAPRFAGTGRTELLLRLTWLAIVWPLLVGRLSSRLTRIKRRLRRLARRFGLRNATDD